MPTLLPDRRDDRDRFYLDKKFRRHQIDHLARLHFYVARTHYGAELVP